MAKLANNRITDVKREYLDTEKRDWRREEPLAGRDFVSPEPTAEELIIVEERLDELMARVPERARFVVRLIALGKTYHGAAAVARCSESDVRRIIKRFLRRYAAV